MSQLIPFPVRVAVLFLILCTLIPLFTAAGQISRNTGEFYIREYGITDSRKNPSVKYAKDVFDALMKASRLETNQKARLIILSRIASKWVNWAMCLPDGSIVIVENILDLCFDNHSIPSEKGKARLAFILAHELSHLVNRDHSFLEKKQNLTFQNDPLHPVSEEIKLIESRADYRGLLLMTMADYEPRYLIDHSNFFQEYIINVRTNTSYREHFTPQKRKNVLTSNLEPLINEIPLYSNGVRLYRQKKYAQAIESFQRFASFFPGREVYNNIGLTYFQLALKELAYIDHSKITRFMLSTVVDPNTLANKLVPGPLGFPKSINRQFKRYIDQSIENLQLSLKKDPTYIPARINLSSVYIIKEDFPQAQKLLDKALQLQPDHPDVINNKAVALYLENPDINGAQALTMLAEIRQNPTRFPYHYSKFNSSRIRFEQLHCNLPLDMDNDPECLTLARKSWSPFLNEEPHTPYSKIVRSELGYLEATPSEKKEKKRIALIIGNSSYSDEPLLNPINDAHAIKNALEHLGFKTDLAINLTRNEMISKINNFGKQLTVDSTGLFYYSGHGLQVRGDNYLLPVDADAEIARFLNLSSDQEEIVHQVAVNINLLLKKMELAKNIQNIIILDACRNSPLPGIDDNYKGFAEMSAPPGTYIAYSTSPGKISWDGFDGKNGIFTSALLNHIYKPALDVQELFQMVRKEVSIKTNKQQVTWDTSTMEDEYYLNPPKKQDWTWHIAAGAIALSSAWMSWEEARKFKELNDENRLLNQRLSQSLDLSEFYNIQSKYVINQEKMKTHKTNFEILDIVTAGALLWEIYLLVFKTYEEGIYPPPKENDDPRIVFQPRTKSTDFSLGIQWNW